MAGYRSWGYSPPLAPQAVQPSWCVELPETLLHARAEHGSLLPFGAGRSYGDSCLNSPGVLIDARGLDCFITLDRERGILRAEAGVSLAQILDLIVPAGFTLPVTPGTAYATLGGAIANDVHGKNHHADGCLGRFIETLTLVRSSGEIQVCSPQENSGRFAATIGGLGLTGFITEATIRLLPIGSAQMSVTYERFHGLDAFVALSDQYRDSHRYTVAWLDCAARGPNLGRGVFMAANHAATGALARPARRRLSVPFPLPRHTLNHWSISAFNSAYFARHKTLHGRTVMQPMQGFFYPLDAIERWNRIYGARGFFQYQFVVPCDALGALQGILQRIAESGMGSFLAVLKEFGALASPGCLSFPRPGLCLALDFAQRGTRTTTLLRELEARVMEAGGAAYPAKDRLMSAAAFGQFFPAVTRFSAHVDPHFASDFWRRVNG